MMGQSGNESVITTLQHNCRELLHSGMGLDMQVSEHGVRMPSAQELDGIRVDVAVEKGSGARSAEGSGGDGGRGETGGVTQEKAGIAE